MATEEEEIVERNRFRGGTEDNDDNDYDANDPFPAPSLPAGPLHSTRLIEAAKEGQLIGRKYVKTSTVNEEGDVVDVVKMVGHELIDPTDYDPYKRGYEAKEEDGKKWRPFRPLPPGQLVDPPALCFGHKEIPSMLLGCASVFCMSLFAFFVIIILFYLEDFGDINVWMYGGQKFAPPPPAEL